MTSSLGSVLAAASGATTGHSWVDIGTFAVAAAIVLSGAIGVVVARNPVHSALMLVMTLFGVAVLFVLQSAPFLAAVQVIVYAGAIVVLFLFVIMFLGVDREENVAVRAAAGANAHWPSAWWCWARPACCCWARCHGGPPVPRTSPVSTAVPVVQRGAARQVGVHHLPVPLRGDGCAAGHRRGRRGGAGPEAPGDGRAPGGRADASPDLGTPEDGDGARRSPVSLPASRSNRRRARPTPVGSRPGDEARP